MPVFALAETCSHTKATHAVSRPHRQRPPLTCNALRRPTARLPAPSPDMAAASRSRRRAALREPRPCGSPGPAAAPALPVAWQRRRAGETASALRPRLRAGGHRLPLRSGLEFPTAELLPRTPASGPPRCPSAGPGVRARQRAGTCARRDGAPLPALSSLLPWAKAGLHPRSAEAS